MIPLSQRVTSPLVMMAQGRRAMMAAQARTGDATLSQTVKAGRFQIVRVVYDAKGRSTVSPVGPWRTFGEHIAALNNFLL